MNTLKLNENHLDDSDARWFAVYTKYKREKLVEKRLRQQGIQVFLPLQRLTRRYERKIKTVEIPLISCYIFTRITKRDYLPVLDTIDVLRFVKFSQNLIAIPDREIRLLQRIAGENIEVEAEPRSFQVGEEVEIISGSLTGFRGILLKTDRKRNFVVELNSIGYSLHMSVDISLLKRVGRSSSHPIRERAGM